MRSQKHSRATTCRKLHPVHVNYVEKPFSCVRDGLVIRGLLFEPMNLSEANDEGKLPVAIVSHMFMVNYKLTVKCGFMKLGRQYVTDVMEMDAFKEISAFEGPVLIPHGTKDTAVDVSNSKKAAEVYKNVQLKLIDSAGHGFFGKKGAEALELLKAFVN